ncbi:MAG: hypothetical protein P9L99_09050 [Candidatus Lernaella stagnicola]|nr:hypothetical protein [Candidatus Lernaella stagnicola]
MKRHLIIWAIVLATGIAACLPFGSWDDDDDDSTPVDENSCRIDAGPMAEVEAEIVANNCEALGLAIVLDQLRVDPTFTVFQVSGQYAINNNNSFYLRGAGVNNAECLAPIAHAGVFEVWTRSLICQTSVRLQVVASAAPDANPFCELEINTSLQCNRDENDTDDDTAGTDDDTGDDDLVTDDDTNSDDDTDEWPACDDIYSFMYDICGFAFFDNDDQEIQLSDVIAMCESDDEDFGIESDIAACIIDNYGDCDVMADCLVALFK